MQATISVHCFVLPRQLSTYTSPNSTTVNWQQVRDNVGLGEGQVGSCPDTDIDPVTLSKSRAKLRNIWWSRATYLKNSLFLSKIIIFVSTLHAFILFLKPKSHLISNVVMNVRRIWALSNSLENMTITRLLVFLTLSFHRCLMIED